MKLSKRTKPVTNHKQSLRSLVLKQLIILVLLSSSHFLLAVEDTTPNPKQFYGLAFYYDLINYFEITADDIKAIDPDQAYTLERNKQLAAVGRFNVQLIRTAQNTSEDIHFDSLSEATLTAAADQLEVIKTTKPHLNNFEQADSLRYNHLWSGLALLSKGMEWLLIELKDLTGLDWGWVIVLFAILLKLITLPLSLRTSVLQDKVNHIHSILSPQLKDIKANFDGEEAHNKIMAAHKALGVSPFYALKPMQMLLFHIPVLIAVFNALGEMPQFDGAHFGWVENLAYPDAVFMLPFTVPFMGETLNAMPFVMLIVSLLAVIQYENNNASISELRFQRIKLALMGLAFFVLFYPFPAVMVMYWTITNLLQLAQQSLVKRFTNGQEN